jgi:hypothetical protein
VNMPGFFPRTENGELVFGVKWVLSLLEDLLAASERNDAPPETLKMIMLERARFMNLYG